MTHFPTVQRTAPCSVLWGLWLLPAFTAPAGLPACYVPPSRRSVLNHVVRHRIALSATTACCVISRLRHF